MISDDIIVYLNEVLTNQVLKDNESDRDSDRESVNKKIKETQQKLFDQILKIIENIDIPAKITELTKLLFYDQENYYIYYLIGHFYRELNLFDEARTFLHLSIKYESLFIGSYLELGLLYQNINNKLSLQFLQKSLNLYNKLKTTENFKINNETYVIILSTLSNVYVDLNMYEDAEETMSIILNDPIIEQIFKDKTKANLSTLHELMGTKTDYKHDLESFDKVNNLEAIHGKLLMLNNILEYVDEPQKMLDEHMKINEFFKDITRFKYDIEYKNRITSRNKIKIGYVTSDLRNHVILRFMYNILRYHTSKFEIYIFYNFKLHDLITDLIKTTLNIKWYDINTMLTLMFLN